MTEESKYIPSPAVTTIVRSLPKSDTVTVSKASKKHKKQKKPAIPKVAETQEKTVPATKDTSSTWLTTVSNLLLLIAIFTIIFSVHRAISNKKQPEQSSEPPAIAVAAPVATTPVTAPVARKKVPLLKKLISPERLADRNNPWNNGGPNDLDNETVRQEYRKRYLSVNESDM